LREGKLSLRALVGLAGVLPPPAEGEDTSESTDRLCPPPSTSLDGTGAFECDRENRAAIRDDTGVLGSATALRWISRPAKGIGTGGTGGGVDVRFSRLPNIDRRRCVVLCCCCCWDAEGVRRRCTSATLPSVDTCSWVRGQLEAQGLRGWGPALGVCRRRVRRGSSGREVPVRGMSGWARGRGQSPRGRRWTRGLPLRRTRSPRTGRR
jgi:hypothetical protein